MLNELLKLGATALIQSLVAQQANAAASRWSTAALLAGGSAVAAIGVAGCLLAALWIYTQPFLGDGGAMLAVAATLAMAWAGFFIATRMGMAKPPAPIQGPPQDLAAEVQALFGKNKTAVMLAALVAGAMAGTSEQKPRA